MLLLFLIEQFLPHQRLVLHRRDIHLFRHLTTDTSLFPITSQVQQNKLIP